MNVFLNDWEVPDILYMIQGSLHIQKNVDEN